MAKPKTLITANDVFMAFQAFYNRTGHVARNVRIGSPEQAAAFEDARAKLRVSLGALSKFIDWTQAD